MWVGVCRCVYVGCGGCMYVLVCALCVCMYVCYIVGMWHIWCVRVLCACGVYGVGGGSGGGWGLGYGWGLGVRVSVRG